MEPYFVNLESIKLNMKKENILKLRQNETLQIETYNYQIFLGAKNVYIIKREKTTINKKFLRVLVHYYSENFKKY